MASIKQESIYQLFVDQFPDIPIGELYIRTKENWDDNRLISGDIAAEMDYAAFALKKVNPFAYYPPLRYRGEWGISRDSIGLYHLRIGDFYVPAAIRKKGVGPCIWHLFYCHLPETVRNNLMLTGTMTSNDAETVAMSPVGLPIKDFRAGYVMTSNIGPRHRFWERMLAPIADVPPLQYTDEAGNGYIRGQFKDPGLPRGLTLVDVRRT